MSAGADGGTGIPEPDSEPDDEPAEMAKSDPEPVEEDSDLDDGVMGLAVLVFFIWLLGRR